MVSLKPAELKFLLKLLGCENYQGAIATLSPDSKTSPTERDRICKSLHEKGLVDYDSEVGRFVIAPPGRTLLTLDSKTLLLTPDELKALKSCHGSTTPGKLSTVPTESRQSILLNLAERGLIKITKTTIKNVWLSTDGKQHMLYHYTPAGTYPFVSGDLLANYVQFLRMHLGSLPSDGPIVKTLTSNAQPEPEIEPEPEPAKPDRKALVATIRQLDASLETHNNLPLFYLREKIQPPLVREELDDMLQALRRNNRLQLKPLKNKADYSTAQIAAGIPEQNGNILFFVTVC